MNNKNNDFNPVIVKGVAHEIAHLKGNDFSLDVEFDNGDVRSIRINVRPTNHLFSRKVEISDWDNRKQLMHDGSWLTSYQHHEGDYLIIKKTPILKEHRLFCEKKWQESFLFPRFIEQIKSKPTKVTVLANAGDDKTCLSGLVNLEERPNEVYLVFFTISKKNSKSANMLIESAYCESIDTPKAQKLSLASKSDKRPFISVLKNIMESRKPFEGKKKNARAHKTRKLKSKKPR